MNDFVELTQKEMDHATYNSVQWFVSGQIEEEKSARILNDKLELISEDKKWFVFI